jgi:hypothetical protein
MWELITIVAALSVLFGICAMINRRMRRQITMFIGSGGGSVRTIKPTLQHRGEFFVVFQSRRGELRRAVARVSSGSVNVIEDQPYHHYLERPAPLKSGSVREVSLDHLRWQVELQNLPGYKDYVQLVRQLMAGPHDAEIAENKERFTATLQCVEMQSMTGREADSGILDLVVEGQSMKMTWRVDGKSPDRVLFLHATLA